MVRHERRRTSTGRDERAADDEGPPGRSVEVVVVARRSLGRPARRSSPARSTCPRRRRGARGRGRVHRGEHDARPAQKSTAAPRDDTIAGTCRSPRSSTRRRPGLRAARARPGPRRRTVRRAGRSSWSCCTPPAWSRRSRSTSTRRTRRGAGSTWSIPEHVPVLAILPLIVGHAAIVVGG